MARRLEVAAGHDLERVPNVDDEGARLVGRVPPRLGVAVPDLQARDGHREEQRGEAKVGVAVHAQPLGGVLVGGDGDGAEKGVAEVAFARGTITTIVIININITGVVVVVVRVSMRLDVGPEVVVGELEDARKEDEEAAVDGLDEVAAKGADFVDKGVQAGRDASGWVGPFAGVKVELLDAVGSTSMSLFA